MKKIRKEHYFELYVFLMDYHGGQWSRGYRIMSNLGPVKISDARSHVCKACIDKCRDSEIYQHLVDNYSQSV